MEPSPFPSPEIPPINTEPKASTHPFASTIARTRKRQLLFGLVGGLIVLSGLIYYFYISSRGGIEVLDTESDLTITLNGQAVKAKKEDKGYFISVGSGTYLLKIEKPNYLPFTDTVNVSRGEIANIRPAFAFSPKTQATTASTSTVDYVRPSLDQKAIFYLGDNRHTIYRMEIADQIPIPLTDTPLQGVTDVEWSSDPDVALIVQTDGVYLREIPKFDFEKQTLYRLGGPEIISPVWDPTNPDRIAFAYFPSNGERSLIFSDKRATQMIRKVDISTIPNPKLIWAPDSSSLLIIGRSADYSKNNLWIYTTADGTLKQLTQGGNILNASYSPSSDIILYESYTTDPYNAAHSTLSTMNVDGSNKVDLQIAGTVAQAAWKDNTSFFLPNPSTQNLDIYSTSGQKMSNIFHFPDVPGVKGMYYFSSSSILIFYTSTEIYRINFKA